MLRLIPTSSKLHLYMTGDAGKTFHQGRKLLVLLGQVKRIARGGNYSRQQLELGDQISAVR